MRKLLRPMVAVSLVTCSFVALAGCGGTPTASKSNSQTPTTNSGATQSAPNQSSGQTDSTLIEGKKQLSQLESTANKNPKDAQLQIAAAVVAYVNKDYKTAIAYYKKAIDADPKNVLAYNNLGNAYYRGLNEPKTAIPYYQKATQIDPKYGNGWLNLAMAEQQVGDKTAAKATLTNGLKTVPASDAAYQSMQGMLKQLK